MTRLLALALVLFGASVSQAKRPQCSSCSSTSSTPSCHRTTTGHFPANKFLGHGLDLTTITPNDVNAVIGNLKGHSIISIDTSSTRTAHVDSVHYNVPDNCFIRGETGAETTVSTYYRDGAAAAAAFECDASLAGKYLAVSGNDASYAISKTFHPDDQYSLFSYQSVSYVAGLKEWASDINVAAFTEPVRHLAVWDHTDSVVVDAYKSFFAKYGTHAITSVEYGARYQLTVWASTADQCVDSEFEADVSFAYNGVTSNGYYDAGVSASCQYNKFAHRKSQQISVQGGDARFADRLVSGYSNRTNYDNFLDWVETTDENPEVTSFAVDSIWNVFEHADCSILRNAAPELKKAFHWIVQNPASHWTYVTLSLNTDWARFRLLSPSAYIIEDPKNPHAAVGAMLTKNQVQLGHEHSFVYTNNTHVSFYVVNDGSPIDFTLSHGSRGHASATAIVNNRPITNNHVTDSYWNEIAYWSVPANPYIHLDTVTATAAARRSAEFYGGGVVYNPPSEPRTCPSGSACSRPRAHVPVKHVHRSHALRPDL